MIITYAQIDPTNRVAKELAAEGRPAGTVVHAVSQSAGKGQYGRCFNSPAGGLYFSLLLEPDLPLEILPLTTLAAGLACRNVLHQAFNLVPFIKWPNDLYLGGKKVAGILCEHICTPHPSDTAAKVIIGVGLNANNRIGDFDGDIQPLVTTLFEHMRKTVDLDALLGHLTQAISGQVMRLRQDRESVLAEWQQYDFLLHRRVVHVCEERVLHGVGQGITSQGLYRLRDDHGAEHELIGGQLRPQPGGA